MAVRRFRLVSLAAFVAALSINTAFAQVNIIPDLPICDSNLSIDGGDDSHQANPATNAVTAGVIVQAFESLDQSAFAEVKRTFTPILSLPVTLTYGPLTYFGELQGFGNTGDIEGSVEFKVTLTDETDGIELAPPVLLLDESEDGGILSQETTLLDSTFSEPTAEFNNVQLIKGHTYSIAGRLSVRAKGLGAKADFNFVANDFGCLTAIVELADSDGDGLYDVWEEDGVDVDADGDIDVDLPAFGANPMHKDLFIEYDWVTGFPPSRNDIQNVKAAFAAAPVDAGGTPNPDLMPGINFWIDTGNATDPIASEDGAGANTCGDGLDNGFDGVADQDDPDCLSGDNFGGGNAVDGPVIDIADNSFYFTKNNPAVQAFTPERKGIFRYGIQGNPADAPSGLGGRAEQGGDDFIVFNRLPGSLFHEIGHTLNLSHGGQPDGVEASNCKPNYVSVMNYHHQLGLRLNGATGGQDLDGDGVPDGRFLDFSPAMIPGGRAQAPLITLDETNLNDGLVLDPTDPVNQFAWVDPNGTLVRAPVNAPVNWNSADMTMELGQQIDVDIDGPSSCVDNVGLTPVPPGLVGYDDWSNIRLAVLADGDLEDAALNPVLEPEPDEAALFALEQQFNTTDVGIAKSDAQDPVEVGDPVAYTLTATNNGPNPASRVIVTDVLPDDVSLLSASPACIEQPAGTLTCELGELLNGEQTQVQLQVDTTEACTNGLPPTLTNQATVANAPQYAGPDTNPANDMVSENTQLLDTTPPVVFCNAPATIIPPDAPISFTATAEDLCDPNPVVELTEFDCFFVTKKGKVIDKTQSCVVSLDGGTVTIEDSGGVDDNIVWTAQATDASGNVGVSQCGLTVAHPNK